MHRTLQNTRFVSVPHWPVAAFLIFFIAALGAYAHEPSTSYLAIGINSKEAAGRLDIPLKDLQMVIPLDADQDGFLTWEELDARYKEIKAYALSHLKISADGKPATIRFSDEEPRVEDFSDGTYLEIPCTFENVAGAYTLELHYQLFFETNHMHRCLLKLAYEEKEQSAVFNIDEQVQRLEVRKPSPLRQFLLFLKEGIWHIWIGFDHILFLLALLLPAVLSYQAGSWRGVPAFRPAMLNVIKIVTAFTLAHSLTLTIATLGLVKLPPRLTESAIAASVIVAATNNIRPWIRGKGWIIAFLFGLVHGFGFANVLADLELNRATLILTLIGFNLGVEIGQLAIIAVFFPLAFGLRNSWAYRIPVFRFGSVCIILIAATWFSERIFNFKVLPF